MSSLATEKDSSNPVYIVVGGAGGIGSEVCRRLSEKKARVVAASRDQQKLTNLTADLGVDHIVLDATISEQVKQCVDQIAERYGRIDGVVNCVGSLLLKPAHLTSDKEWNATITNNLHSAFYVLRSAVRPMMKTGGGSIVLISSAAARVGMANHEAIAAAKAGPVVVFAFALCGLVAVLIALCMSELSTGMPLAGATGSSVMEIQCSLPRARKLAREI